MLGLKKGAFAWAGGKRKKKKKKGTKDFGFFGVRFLMVSLAFKRRAFIGILKGFI